MRPALRLCSHATVIAGLVGGAALARPRIVLSPRDASGESLAFTVAGLAVVVCIGWLVLVSLAYVATVRTRHEYVARTCLKLMPRFMRRLLEVALVTSAAATPALPASAAPRMSTPALRRDVPVVRTMASATPPVSATASRPSPARSSSSSSSPGASSAPRTPAPPPADHTHVVQPGDNLWRIAKQELATRHGGSPPDELTTARYWQQIVAANRGTLRSGNPSLIYPGELVALPPAE